jgi:hypothetical protein
MPYKISDDQLIADLVRVKNQLNKYPSYEDMKKFGNFGVRTYQNIVIFLSIRDSLFLET